MAGMFTFTNRERLSSKKLIQKLFKEGNSFYLHPFKVFYIPIGLPEDTPAQVLISVSRRNFRKAVTRNYIKRLIRESYRLNKPDLYDVLNINGKQYAIGIIYVDREIPDSEFIHERIIKVISRLNRIHM